MSTAQKERFEKWLPSLVTLAIQIAAVSYWGGTITSRLSTVEEHVHSETVHTPMAKKVELFVTRAEFTAEKATHADDRISMRSIEAKLDRLIERGSKGE